MAFRHSQLLAVALLLSVGVSALAARQDAPAGTESYKKPDYHPKDGHYEHHGGDYYPNGGYNAPHDYPHQPPSSYPSYGDYPHKTCNVCPPVHVNCTCEMPPPSGTCTCAEAAPGTELCGNECRLTSSFQSDPLNCGSCGRACDVTEMCDMGDCVPITPPTCDPPMIRCGTDCVMPDTSDSNCGGCPVLRRRRSVFFNQLQRQAGETCSASGPPNTNPPADPPSRTTCGTKPDGTIGCVACSGPGDSGDLRCSATVPCCNGQICDLTSGTCSGMARKPAPAKKG